MLKVAEFQLFVQNSLAHDIHQISAMLNTF